MSNCFDPALNPNSTLAPIPPPEGVTANFDNPVSHNTQLLVANVVCLSITSVFVTGRLYSKYYLARKVHSDDVMCIIAMFLSIGLSVGIMIATRFGYGVHCYEFKRENEGNFFKMQAALYAIYSGLIFFVKAAILLMYIRIFDASRFVKYSVWSLFIPLAAFSVSSVFLSVFPCRPVRKFWTPRLEGKCINTGIIGWISAIVSIFTDVAIFVLPLPQVWKMRLPLRQRLQVIAVLGTGLFAVRVFAFAKVFSEFDIPWNVYNAALFTILEVNVGIIVGCMPTLKPLLRRHLPALFATSNGRSPHPKHTPSSGFSKSSRLPYTDLTDLDDIPLSRTEPGRDDELELGFGTRVPTSSTAHSTMHYAKPTDPEAVRPPYPFPMI